MKRKLFSIYALVLTLMGVLATGCSNDDIDIQGLGSLEIRVSTQSVYDQFKVTSSVQQQILAKGNGKIGTYCFIYDEAGNLVFNGFQSENTFNSVSFTTDQLTEGSYTAIVVETIVDNDDTESDWEMVGIDNLSTLAVQDVKLAKDYAPSHYWYNVVGVAVKEFSLSGDLSLDMSPKGIGSIFLNHFVNFEDSQYERGAFGTKNAILGRRLSPAYQGNDRFINAEYTDGGHIYVRTPTAIDEYDSQVHTYILETGDITAMLCAGKEGSTSWSTAPGQGRALNITDGSRYYGGAVYTDNTFYGNFTDTWDELNAWVDTILGNDTPTPTPSQSFVAPYETWGATATTVNNYMTGNGFANGVRTSGAEMDYVRYETTDGSLEYIYSFVKTTGGLNSVIINFAESAYTLDSVQTIIAKDYTFVTVSDGTYLYASASTIVGILTVDGGFAAVYMPNTNNAPTRSADIIRNLVPAGNKVGRVKDNRYMWNQFSFKK